MEKYKQMLKELIGRMEATENLWDGEVGGTLEENAHIASDINDKCVDILNLIDTFNN